MGQDESLRTEWLGLIWGGAADREVRFYALRPTAGNRYGMRGREAHDSTLLCELRLNIRSGSQN